MLIAGTEEQDGAGDQPITSFGNEAFLKEFYDLARTFKYIPQNLKETPSAFDLVQDGKKRDSSLI